VTMVGLQHPVPPNGGCCPPQDFHTYESATCTGDPPVGGGGCARWVGKPGTFLESQDLPALGNYRAARLQCSPFYADWVGETASGPITVVGAEIMPSSTYDVQTYGVSCKDSETGCPNVSAAVAMLTRRSGDVNTAYNPPATSTQPDAIDVTALVNKFKNVTGASGKAVTQLQPNVPELNADINALDIVAVVDAVKGLAYPFAGPCPCPSLVTCGPGAGGRSCSGVDGCKLCVGGANDGKLCLAAGDCPSGTCGGATGKVTGTCIKTCTGGANAGDACINNTHCPSSSCGTGYCRDRCVRCKP